MILLLLYYQDRPWGLSHRNWKYCYTAHHLIWFSDSQNTIWLHPVFPLHEQHKRCQIFTSPNCVSKNDIIWSPKSKFSKTILRLKHMLVYIDNVDIMQYKQCLDQKNYSKDKYYALNTFMELFSQFCQGIFSLRHSIESEAEPSIFFTIHLQNEYKNVNCLFHIKNINL